MPDSRTLDTTTGSPEHLDLQFRQLESRLIGEYGSPAASSVHDLVETERARFAGARIHVFLPILIERAVRSQLGFPAH